MSKTLSEFLQIPQQTDLWSAQKGTLRCTALRLRDGSLCLFSPVSGLGRAAMDSLAALGEVAFLLAPNHFHNKGLAEYTNAFPDAVPVCSERARPRLEKQTGLSFGKLHPLGELLPDNGQIVEPDGLKTGEVWLTMQTGEETVWVVCDAFKGASGKTVAEGVRIELLGTFPTYGVKNMGLYATWVKARLIAQPPTLVVPCHGGLVRSETLVTDITLLLD